MASWGVLGAFWGPLGASWAHVGASEAHLGASWRRLGASWARLGASWSVWSAFSDVLGASRRKLCYARGRIPWGTQLRWAPGNTNYQDKATFTDCSNNQTYPVAKEGNFYELEATYIALKTQAQQKLLFEVKGDYAMRPPEQGDDVDMLIPTELLGVVHKESCP